jgi:hypothetical protein
VGVSGVELGIISLQQVVPTVIAQVHQHAYLGAGLAVVDHSREHFQGKYSSTVTAALLPKGNKQHIQRAILHVHTPRHRWPRTETMSTNNDILAQDLSCYGRAEHWKPSSVQRSVYGRSSSLQAPS